MRIVIDLAAQRLDLFDGETLACSYPVSTAARGAGERKGSFQTPRGLHIIRAKIGAGLPSGAVLKGRRASGEICTPELQAANPERDWILSRILWLSGTQAGFNRLGEVDTMARYIYLHGTPDSEPMGIPASHGCVRMRNADLIALFDRVAPGTEVLIEDADLPPQWVVCTWSQARAALLEHGIAICADHRNSSAHHLLQWDRSGHLIAYARLTREGLFDGLHGALDAGLLAQAFGLAREHGWFELRALADPSQHAFLMDAGFMPRGDALPETSLQAFRCFLPQESD